MMFPWNKRAAEQEKLVEEEQERLKEVNARWNFVLQQIQHARFHEEQNHITQLVLNIVRGT